MAVLVVAVVVAVAVEVRGTVTVTGCTGQGCRVHATMDATEAGDLGMGG